MGPIGHGLGGKIDAVYTVKDVLNIHYELGTKLLIKEKVDKTVTVYEAVVVEDYLWHFVVRVDTKDYGSYFKSINKINALCAYGFTLIKEVA